LEYQPKSLPKVSILIPAIDTGEYVVDCLKSVLSKTDYPDYEVRVLTESGHDTSITRQLSAIADEDARVTVVQNRPNKSGVLNSFASEAKGEYLLWLNQDTVVLQKEWLVRLVGCCDREAVGVVGARVINRRKTLVSGGVVTGIGSRGVGGRCNEDLHMQSPGYIGRAQLEQEMDAVPSLCMLVSKTLHAETGGFDPQLSISLFRDIDFCQHVREKGKRIVWTPRVTVMYLAERTQVDGVASSDKQAEGQAKILRQRWLHTIVQAPAYNRNLNAMRGDYTLETDRVRGWDPEIDHKPRILTYGTGSYGSWQYRVRQPLDVIQGQGVLHVTHTAFVGKKMTSIPSVAEVERLQPTALLMHNTMHDDFIKSMENYKQENNAFIIFGQDDLMTALPPKNPFAKTVYKDVKKRVRKCLSLADRLVVTTEPLAHALSGMVDDIRVVPNYLDESIWGALQSKRHAGAKPRVGWAGAQQHLGDLELLEEVVRETASEVDWVFFGMCPPFLRPYVKEVHDAVEFQRYPEKLAQLNLDIALAPLEHNRFNESKSNLRLLEYGILGWAVVASDIHPYRNAPVCRVPNQARAWINAIRERINDLDSTWKEGDRLRDWVRAEWFLHQNAEQWLTALDPASSPVPQYRDRTRAAGL
jgi:GT2 family glycosyltransferase